MSVGLAHRTKVWPERRLLLATIRRNPHGRSPPHSGRPANGRAPMTALGRRSDACSGVGYRRKLVESGCGAGALGEPICCRLFRLAVPH
jgi:hypothetical protein